MANVFKRVMTGSAIVAGITTAAYLTASISAYADGQGTGLEIAPPVNIMSIILIVCSTMCAGGAWISEHSHRIASDRHTRPVVRDEVDQALADAMPLLVATVAEAVAKRIDPALHAIAVSAANRTAAAMREAITADLTETVSAVYRRGQITGAIMHSEATGAPAPRSGGLRSVRQYVSTSEGD